MRNPARLPTTPHRARRTFALPSALLLLLASSALAQVAPAPGLSAAPPAKYDTNKNGRLDPAEQAALDADLKKSATAASPATAGESKHAEEVVALSPFEVVSDTKGYYGANTMSGTRFNSKLEDLASSISVIT